MRVQHQRTDVLPLTWEIPATIALGWFLVTALGLPAGQSVAYAISGQGLAWPTGDLLGDLGALISGQPGVGVAEPPPPEVVVYAAIAAVELAVAVIAGWVAAWWWRTSGPGAQYGLASKHEIRAVLGERQLHRRTKTIRPDLTCSEKR